MALEIRTIPVLDGANAERLLHIIEEGKNSNISINDEMWKDFARLEERSKNFSYRKWRKTSI